METGIFAKTFNGSLPEVLQAVQQQGINRIQFNFACAGLPSMPDAVEEQKQIAIKAALEQIPMNIEAVSGTFNMIHPDPAVRVRGLHGLKVIAQQCEWLGTNLITLCTGSGNPANMWKAHPGNNNKDAWKDLRQTLDRALEIAECYNLILGFEPETANVINTVDKAAKLLRETGSVRLQVVFDPANLFQQESLQVIRERIEYGLDLLGDHIVSVHAKDRNIKGEVVPAGMGILPYQDFFQGLKRIGYEGNLILHGLAPQEVATSLRFLQKQLIRAGFS